MTQRPSAGQDAIKAPAGVVQARPIWLPALVRGVARVPRSPPEEVGAQAQWGIRSSGKVFEEDQSYGCKLFHSADLPVLAVECHAPLVTLGRGTFLGGSHFPGDDLCLRRGPCYGAALLSGREVWVIKSECESLLFASVRSNPDPGGSFVHVGQACCHTLRKVFRKREGGS